MTQTKELVNSMLPELAAGNREGGDALARRGGVLASADPLAALIRGSVPGDAGRRGFDIGMAVAEGHTLPGPGKDRFGDELPPGEQPGYRLAVQFSVDRNRTLVFANNGAEVVKADPALSSVRDRLPLGLAWLGFNIASGIFGPTPLGAGHTLAGPGSTAIRDHLGPDARRGFEAAAVILLERLNK